MNDFHGLLSTDFGFKPHGKSAPMAPPSPNPITTTTTSSFNFDIGGRPKPSPAGSFLDDHDNLFRPPPSFATRKPQVFSNLSGFDHVFGGVSSRSNSAGNLKSSVNLDSIFSGSGDTGSKLFSLPVSDDDVLDGVDGIKSPSSGGHHEPFSSSSKRNDGFDDLLGGLGRNESQSKGLGGAEKGIPGFDDLFNGFGGNSASAPNERCRRTWEPVSGYGWLARLDILLAGNFRCIALNMKAESTFY